MRVQAHLYLGDTAKAGLQQSDHSEFCNPAPPYPMLGGYLSNLLSTTKVLLITMALSFGIDDYIEGGVITAVILLNIVVGHVLNNI